MPAPTADLRGVGGWLAFFLISLSLLSPLRAYEDLTRTFFEAEGATAGLVSSPLWRTYKTILWSALGAQVGLSWIAGWLLVTTTRRGSVRWTIGLLWSVTLVLPLLTFFAVSSMLGPKMGAAQAETAIVTMVAGSVWAAVWTAYLLRSRRVKNTYVDSPPSLVAEH